MWASLAANIPDGLVFGIVPIAFSLLCGWGAWVTLLSARTEGRAKSNTEDLADHETRIRKLEARR